MPPAPSSWWPQLPYPLPFSLSSVLCEELLECTKLLFLHFRNSSSQPTPQRGNLQPQIWASHVCTSSRPCFSLFRHTPRRINAHGLCVISFSTHIMLSLAAICSHYLGKSIQGRAGVEDGWEDGCTGYGPEDHLSGSQQGSPTSITTHISFYWCPPSLV